MHTFIVQVKVAGIDRLKYLEISYNPKTLKVTSDFEWNEEEGEFVKSEVDKEVEAINS